MDTAGNIIEQLEELRWAIDYEEGLSKLQLARVVDLTSSVLTGDSTSAAIKEIQKSKNTAATIELIDTAISTLRSQSKFTIIEPERGPQLQAFISYALIKNRLFIVLFSLLFFAYLGAVGIWGVNVKDSFGLVEGAREKIDELNQLIKETEDQSKTVKKRLNAALTNSNDVAEKALSGIEAQQKVAEKNIQDAAVNANKFIDARKTEFTKSVERLQQKFKPIEENLEKLGTRLGALHKSVDNLSEQEQGIGETLSKLPEQLEILVKQGGQIISRQVEGEIPSLLGALNAKYDRILSNKIDELSNDAVRYVDDWRMESKDRLDSANKRLGELDKEVENLWDRRRDLENEFGSLSSFADRVSEVEKRIDASDDSIRMLNEEIGPVRNLISDIRDRSRPVAILLAEAMKNVSNEELAQQLWLNIKTNYVIIGLSVFIMFAFIWLCILSYKVLRLSQNGENKKIETFS